MLEAFRILLKLWSILKVAENTRQRRHDVSPLLLELFTLAYCRCHSTTGVEGALFKGTFLQLQETWVARRNPRLSNTLRLAKT